MTNAWHMFALSPSPQGEACSRRLYIAECVSLCIYATEGKVTARCIAMRCPVTPGSWGARSHGSDLPVSHKEMSPSCRKFACIWTFGDLWGWCWPQDGTARSWTWFFVLEETAAESRGAAADSIPVTHLGRSPQGSRAILRSTANAKSRLYSSLLLGYFHTSTTKA